MRRHIVYLALTLSVLLLVGDACAQENWAQWRGPDLNGVSAATNLPGTWSETENIVWKTPLPAWGAATPIIWGDRIFITSPSKGEAKQPSAPPQQEEEGGRRRRRGGREDRDPGGDKLLLICISKTDGAVLWQRELGTGNRLYRKQNNSSPSPVTDGEHVWVVTGTGAVLAFDMNGNKIWEKNLQEEYGTFGLLWGYASSPLLHDGKLIIEVLHGNNTDDPSYIVAFDAETGQELWRQERITDAEQESPDAYTTPTLLRHGGETQIVISGGDYVTGHDPETGKEIWRAGGLNPRKRGNYRIVASPIVVGDMIYAPSREKPLLALRAGGTGDVTVSNFVWKWDAEAAPDVPTPACDGTYFYMVDDRGVITCLNAKNGGVIWGPERTAPGTVSASPLVADGKIYITNEDAVTTVLAAGREFRRLANNQLDGGYTLASIAVSGSRLYMRTATHLYCIGK